MKPVLDDFNFFISILIKLMSHFLRLGKFATGHGLAGKRGHIVRIFSRSKTSVKASSMKLSEQIKVAAMPEKDEEVRGRRSLLMRR